MLDSQELGNINLTKFNRTITRDWFAQNRLFGVFGEWTLEKRELAARAAKGLQTTLEAWMAKTAIALVTLNFMMISLLRYER